MQENILIDVSGSKSERQVAMNQNWAALLLLPPPLPLLCVPCRNRKCLAR